MATTTTGFWATVNKMLMTPPQPKKKLTGKEAVKLAEKYGFAATTLYLAHAH